MKKLKLLTWNIRQGGKKEIKNIVASLVHHDADLIVLTEFRENAAGQFLRQEMQANGWHCTISSDPPGKENGLLLLSRFPLEDYPTVYGPEQGSHRWRTVYSPDFNLYFLGVHVPNVNETYDKRLFLEKVTEFAEKNQDNRAVIMGDFNTVSREENAKAPLKYSNYIHYLQQLGWVDAWKKCHPTTTDYTWYSTKQNGFRLDYIFLSSKIANLLNTSNLSQQERLNNYSDHALVVAELLV